MKRMFWMAVGAAVGIAAVRKLSRTRTALSPQGLNRAVGALSDSVRYFADAVREGMAEREADLRAALGVDAAAGSRRR